jgi:hypothetical protein
MGDDKSEINISLFGGKDPFGASKLAEVLGNGLGALYEPTRIRRRAKAEADAALIRKKSDVEIAALERRSKRRLGHLELRRQKNIDEITHKAFEVLPNYVSKDPVDEDWIVTFFQHCQDIGNEQMQLLWAKLLAGEVAQPGTFSPRTLSLIKNLSPREANLFSRFCSYFWRKVNPDLGYTWFPMLKTVDAKLPRGPMDRNALLHLDTIGLIKFSQSQDFDIDLREKDQICYFETRYSIDLDPKQDWRPNVVCQLKLGPCTLTEAGTELAPIAGAQPYLYYRDRAVVTWEVSITGLRLRQVPARDASAAQ